jgi:NAD(P)-dependent dehydrogenase (short-subunit alcohol dehydrogenase family)
MTRRLAGKAAIVTGAGSIGPGWGNGKAIAVLFAREGARVVAVDRNRAAAEETRGLIEAEGGQCRVVEADVACAADVARIAADGLSAFGRIDVLVNNVGIVSLGGAAAVEEAEWDRVMAVNLKSMFLTCRAVLPVMERQGAGAIVNIASIAGIRDTGVAYVTYNTTKGAVLPFTRAIAMEYARKGIRANSVLPGLLDTPMVEAGLAGAYAEGDVSRMKAIRAAQVPMGRMGDAWDTAYAALYLASDEAKYVTGAELVVDGGITSRIGG